MRVLDQLRVVLVLILGIMALALLTWGIGRIYLELLGQSSHEYSLKAQSQSIEKTSQDTILTLPKVGFWTCQVGLFQNEHNAQLLRDQLMVMGYKAEIVNVKPWMVGIGLGHSAEELKGLRLLLEEKGFPSIPKQIVLAERSFRVAGNGGQLTAELLKNANTILGTGFSKEVLTREEQLWLAQAGEHPPLDLERLHEFYNQLRAKKTLEEQKIIGFSLFFESERIINRFSGK